MMQEPDSSVRGTSTSSGNLGTSGYSLPHPATIFEAIAIVAKDRGGSYFPHPTLMLLDATTIGGFVGKDAATVQRWARDNQVPCRKCGDTHYYDVDEFMSHMPRVTYAEAESERGGDTGKAGAGKVEGNRSGRVERPRKARPKNKDV